MNKLIIAIVSLFLVFIFTILYFLPAYQGLRHLEKEIQIEETEILKREEKLKELRKTSEDLKNYPEQLAKIDSALPFDADLPALFDFIEKAASQSGLVLKSISHSAANPSLDFAELEETEVSLALSGVYASLKNFLPILETTARLVETQSVSFSALPEEGPREFKLTIKVYSY